MPGLRGLQATDETKEGWARAYVLYLETPEAPLCQEEGAHRICGSSAEPGAQAGEAARQELRSLAAQRQEGVGQPVTDRRRNDFYSFKVAALNGYKPRLAQHWHTKRKRAARWLPVKF